MSFWLALGAVADLSERDRVTAGDLHWSQVESRVDAHRVLDLELDTRELPVVGREDEPFYVCMTAVPTASQAITIDVSPMAWIKVAHDTEAHGRLDDLLDMYHKQLAERGEHLGVSP